MITNKDIRVENGNLVLNGDKFPLDGQSPDAIMAIVEDNSDTTPTENSTAPVTSGGVFTALGTKQDTLTFDSAPTDASTNPVTSGGIYTALGTKQDSLTFDNAPTVNSTNPVESGGVYSAIAGILSTLDFKLFGIDDYPSWDNFPDFAFGYGYQSQTNNPGSNGFCICFGSSSVKIQIFFAITQTTQKYRTYSSNAWTNWKEF